MKVAVFDLSEWERGAFAALRESHGWEVRLRQERLGPGYEPEPEMADADALTVFVHSEVDGAVLERFPSLGCVATRSTGYDHIDADACRARDVAIYTVPDYGSVTVAEYTLAMMLALLRRVRPMVEQSLHGTFAAEALRGRDLAGKTVGVVGTGKIGREVIRRLDAFSVRILAHDKYPDETLPARFPSMSYVELSELFGESDLLTFHVPLSDETHHIFDREALRQVPWGSYLVNTSRGPVVETAAVVEGLREGRLAGVALDTFESEAVIMEEEFHVSDQLSQAELRDALATYHLLRSDRVILSPHNAYNSVEALGRIVETTIANLEAFAEGSDSANRLA